MLKTWKWGNWIGHRPIFLEEALHERQSHMPTQKATLALRELERQAVQREGVEVMPPANLHVDAGRRAGDLLAHEGDRRRDNLEKAVETSGAGAVHHNDGADVHVRGSTVKERGERYSSESPWQSAIVELLQRSSYSRWWSTRSTALR